MTYSTLIQKELINSQFLVVIRPRRRVTSWVFVSGTTWTNAFDYGNPYGIKLNGSTLAFTYANGTITISTATNPNTAFTIVTYELYVGTNDAHWYSNPLSTASTEVYFEPMVAVSPQLKQTAKDILFGYLPVQTSSITLNNVTGFMNRHVYDSSFHNAQINLYHWLGDTLDVANIKLLMSGLTSQVTINDITCTISIFSSLDLLDKDFRPAYGNDAFWPVSTWANSDKAYDGTPVRYVYGMAEGVPLVNLNVDPANTNAVNRLWGIAITGESANLIISKTIQSGGTVGGAGVYIPLDNVDGLNIGDVIYYLGNDSNDHYARIFGISGNTVELYNESDIGQVGGNLDKYSIGYIKYVVDNVDYTLFPSRDFTLNVDATSKIFYIQLQTTAEANVGAPVIEIEKAKLYARIYGRQNDVTINANPLGGDGARTGVMDNSAPIIVDLLKSQLGVSDSEINEASFTTFETLAHPIGFMVPTTLGSDYPTIKDIVADILKTEIAKLYIDADGKWAIKVSAPITSSDYSTDDTEILRASFNYSFDYSELASDIIVNYRIGEETFIEENIDEFIATPVRVTSNYCTYVHELTKQKSFDSLLIHESDATEYATRLSYIFGDRTGRMTISLKNRFLETNIADDYTISRVAMPGFELDLDIERTRNFAVIDAVRSLSEVTIQLDDQKGIEDNAGSW